VHVPERSCVGCRRRAPQATLVRFVQRPDGWRPDVSVPRAPGRGAYVCSPECAARARKNRRYPGLADAAETIEWALPPTGVGGMAAGRV